jgi:hypothetical protein
MPEGGTLKIACRDASRRRVEVDVEDTGSEVGEVGGRKSEVGGRRSEVGGSPELV